MARKIGADLGDQADSIKAAAASKKAPSVNVDQETFLKAISTMVDHNRKMEAVRKERTAARKQIKAQGIELGHLDATIRMGEWGRDEVRQWFDTQRIYAQFYNLPVGSQPELFKDMDEEQISAAEWTARGVTAGIAGKDGVPPEECPGEHHQAFMQGWRQGQDKLVSAMGDDTKAKKPAAKKPAAKKPAKGKAGKVTPEEAKKQIREYADGKKGQTPSVQGDKVTAGKPAPKPEHRADDFQEDPPKSDAANDGDSSPVNVH